MSGEDRRSGGIRGWLLPMIVLAVGVALASGQGFALRSVALKPVNWAGLAVMAAGLIAVVAASIAGGKGGAPGRTLAAKLLGVLACGIGAILVICL